MAYKNSFEIMKIITVILGILLIGISNSSFSQSDTITTSQAKNFIDKEVVLKGILKNLTEFKDRNGKDILFLDIDDVYPNTLIGVTVFPDAFSDVKIKKEDVGKTVFISGVVQDYRGKPSLPIYDAKQLEVKN
jgi:DNA/RNA endonuclease YhcR with UshA esterase domain